MTFKVSQSKIKLYRRCRHAYHLKYVEKLRRKRVSRPLQFGRIIHEMLDASAARKDPFEVLDAIAEKNARLFRAEREMYGDIIEDSRIIMTEYLEHYKGKDMVPIKVKGQFAEHKFEVPISNRVILTGRIDRVADYQGLRLLVEHKTFNRMPGTDEQWRNLQSASYIRVMDMLGWPEVDGTLWDFIHSKAPAAPQLLKNGQMSTRAITTLPSKVLAVAKEEGLKPRVYQHVLDAAKRNRSSYFKRIVTPLKPKVVSMIFKDLVATATEMVDCHGEVKDRNIDRHCSYCDFEPLCRAAFQGADVGFIKTRDYIIHEKGSDD